MRESYHGPGWRIRTPGLPGGDGCRCCDFLGFGFGYTRCMNLLHPEFARGNPKWLMATNWTSALPGWRRRSVGQGAGRALRIGYGPGTEEPGKFRRGRRAGRRTDIHVTGYLVGEAVSRGLPKARYPGVPVSPAEADDCHGKNSRAEIQTDGMGGVHHAGR